MVETSARRRFLLVLIKPSHYDDDGYVIQWWKAWIPSNSLACLYGLARDLSERKALGEEIEIELEAFDEMNALIPFRKLLRRFRDNGNFGLVALTGVQSNQFPRAMDIARPFRDAGVQVAVGGFHVSGCLSMLDELPPDLREAQQMGVTFFAGEAEERLEGFLRDAIAGQLKPVYNYLNDLPGLEGQVTPFLPERLLRRYDGGMSSFDAGRGCPFQCSFCTIINVQGRKSRYRSADDIERIIRANYAQGINHYFITDDNFARNKNWEAHFDRMIELREEKGMDDVRFVIQVDALCHKTPRFIEKAARAGCRQVFIGLENIDPENLKAANKKQNRITEYRTMFQMWREAGVITYAGYIIGFPVDTLESLTRSMEIIKRELPVDVLQFAILTPLPGSEDHKNLWERGVPMDSDMNRYDLEHQTTDHPLMSREALQKLYRRIWDIYFTDDHVETLMRRAMGYGIKPVRIWQIVVEVYGVMRFELVNAQQGGFFRRKARTQRRPGYAIESPLVFYPKRVWQALATYIPWGLYAWKIHRLRKRIQNDESARNYRDFSMMPVEDAEHEELEMFEVNEAARAAVAKAQADAVAREARKKRKAQAPASAAE
jgi:radical SAM superfamily enzyme YgiQ (UPF0313 family)